MKRNSKPFGFTLIEVALMLVILGLLLGMGVSLIGPLVKRSKLAETREAVKAAKEAFVGYAVKNGYLPLQEYMPGQPNTYDPNKPGEAFSRVGVKGTDAYGRSLLYLVAEELESDNRTIQGTSACDNQTHALVVDLCSVKTTSMTLKDGQDRNNVAFIIVSGGENQNIQTDFTIYPMDFPDKDDFYDDINRPEPYDDVVLYVTLNELRHLRGCQNLQVVTPDVLPTADDGRSYTVALEARGGVPPYTWKGNPVGGLHLEKSGTLSGIVDSACQTRLNFRATVCDRTGQSLSWEGEVPVRLKPLNIVTEQLPVGCEGRFYSAKLVADGYVPYIWALSVTPPCPKGLICSEDSFQGIPSAGSAGSYEVLAVVTDHCGQRASKTFGLTIHPAYACGGTGGGDNGTGGGGGGGGGSPLYGVLITNQGNTKSYKIGGAGCTEMGTNYRRYHAGISAGTMIEVHSSDNCTGRAISSGTAQQLDTNGDYLVEVECSGNTCDSK